MAVWTAGDPYVTLFGVRAACSWLFVLPVIAVLPTVAGAVAAVRGWRRGWWSPRVRVLHAVAAAVREAGYRIGNVDCSVILEAPKLAPHRAEMEDRLSAAAGAPVSVKAKRAEGLGALGRREGIACYAVALVETIVEVDVR